MNKIFNTKNLLRGLAGLAAFFGTVKIIDSLTKGEDEVADTENDVTFDEDLVTVIDEDSSEETENDE